VAAGVVEAEISGERQRRQHDDHLYGRPTRRRTRRSSLQPSFTGACSSSWNLECLLNLPESKRHGSADEFIVNASEIGRIHPTAPEVVQRRIPFWAL
jgi:hypothetical protein